MTVPKPGAAPSTEPSQRRNWALWLVVGLPVTAVVASFITLGIALHDPDTVVADDYYKRGLAINKSIDRDQRAEQLGVGATVAIDPVTGLMTLRLSTAEAAGAAALPADVGVRLVHAAKADRDIQLTARRDTDGTWRAIAPREAAGQRWSVLVETADWRLKGGAVPLGAEPVRVVAASPERRGG